MNMPLHLTSPSRWPFSRLIISSHRRKPRVSWAASLQHGYAARGTRGIRRSYRAWVCGRAQLSWWRYCPKLGPPGSQLVHRPCPHLADSEEQMCPCGGVVTSSCFAASVGPGQFKPLLCYLNLSSLVTASSLRSGGVCALQVSAQLPLWGSPVRRLGGGKACTAASCASPSPVPSMGLGYP